MSTSTHRTVAPASAAATDWREHALCSGEEPELFFPVGYSEPAQAQGNEAKAVCRRCDVREHCLAWALDAGIRDGVWGGLGEDERRALRAESRAGSGA